MFSHIFVSVRDFERARHFYGQVLATLGIDKRFDEPDTAPRSERALNILAISGSVRTASINTAFLRAAAQLMPSDVQLTVYQALDRLPIFNPDLEPAPPAQIVQWRHLVAQADALLIASPEYAHGVTGAMKNALDWLVSHEPFVNKPVAVVNTSDRAHHADDALRETLITMNAHLVERASITVPLLGAQISADDLPSTQLVVDACATILEGLRHARTQRAA